MCNRACLIFAENFLKPWHVSGLTVLEVGSRNVNGSVRDIIGNWNPKRYEGIDIEPGPGVDTILDVCDLPNRYESQSFDLVVCTEVLEHVKDWRRAIYNLKWICTVGGQILLTTRSPGFHVHGYPNDYWRFTDRDMMAIFADMPEKVIVKDSKEPGIFVYARKMHVNKQYSTDLSKITVAAVEMPGKGASCQE